jgi:response regulator of citrate/malate metabolism
MTTKRILLDLILLDLLMPKLAGVEVLQARLFEKFYRADNVLAIETEGTGLGLCLVRLAGAPSSCP